MEVAMKKNTKKVKNILEALPYMEKFRNNIFVFKFGGSMINDEYKRQLFINDIILLKHLNMKVVLIHGGGKHISIRLDEKGIKGKFHKGYRITTNEAMAEVEMVLSGNINKTLTLNFVNKGIDAVGLTGKDAGLIKAKQKIIDQHVDIGNVGDIIGINSNFLHMLLDQYYLPIISPIGYDDHGRTYNINADDVASAVAIALDAEKLFLISDVEGLYKDFNDKDSFISSLTLAEGKALVADGIIKGGMLPKLKSCINAVDQGEKEDNIVDGRLEHAVLLEIFTDSGVGTLLKGENYDTHENI